MAAPIYYYNIVRMASTVREAAYFSAYKPIRNALRKYSPASVLEGALQYLYYPAQDSLTELKKQPWAMLLLIKWAFIDEEAGRIVRPSIPHATLMQLHQRTHELADKTRMPNEYEHVSMFVRTIGFQQFLYQRPLRLLGIARQELLFADVPYNHFFRTTFLKETGISVGDFLRLSCCLLAPFIQTTSFAITAFWFSTLSKRFSKSVIESFLRSLSVDIEKLPRVLRAADRVGRRPPEYFEQTPFLAYPLVKIGQRYLCVHPKILLRSTEHFVYDLLKRTDPTAFNAAFGPRFESYVERLLRASGSSIATENELKKFLPGSGRLVDFLIADGDANVFVDAKGVEMANRGKVAHLRDVILGATKTSLIAAVSQAYDVNSRLPKMTLDHPVIRKRAKNYLLVVTYKELYIGNGVALSESVGSAAIDKIRNRYSFDEQIPLEHMYFLTIEEFEHLLEYVRVRKFQLAEALEKAKLSDADPQSRKFIFDMHMREWGPAINGPPATLSAAMDVLFGDVELAFAQPASTVRA